MTDYLVVGLTGQSGAGKTTVSQQFKDSGFYVINCDTVSRIVTQKGSACNKKICEFFPSCFNSELELDRKELGKIVFNSKEKLECLNNIIFPFIKDYIQTEIDKALNNGNKNILLDAPTLFEAKMDTACDYIVSVIADYDLRLNRICKRDNISLSLAKSRFASQKSQEFFIEKSDYVIKNNTDLNSVIIDTQNVIARLKETSNGNHKEKKKASNSFDN